MLIPCLHAKRYENQQKEERPEREKIGFKMDRRWVALCDVYAVRASSSAFFFSFFFYLHLSSRVPLHIGKTISDQWSAIRINVDATSERMQKREKKNGIKKCSMVELVFRDTQKTDQMTSRIDELKCTINWNWKKKKQILMSFCFQSHPSSSSSDGRWLIHSFRDQRCQQIE